MTTRKSKTEYPPLPDKKLCTIGEAAALACSEPHTLRYWEKRIPSLAAAVARRRGRRYYDPAAVSLLRRINTMVNDNGYTIAGVRAALAERSGGEKKNAALRRALEQISTML